MCLLKFYRLCDCYLLMGILLNRPSKLFDFRIFKQNQNQTFIQRIKTVIWFSYQMGFLFHAIYDDFQTVLSFYLLLSFKNY